MMLSKLQKLVNACVHDILRSKKYSSHGEKGTKFVPQWGVIIPHDSVRQGAYSPEKVSEYSYAPEMVLFSCECWATRNRNGVRGAA